MKPGSPKRGRWRRVVLLTAASVLLLLVVLVLERSPQAERNPAPTAADVRGAKDVYERVRAAQHAPGSQNVTASWQELAAVAALGGRAAGFERVNFVREADRGHLRASLGLPLGFWLNGHAFLTPDDKGRLRISARLGDLPIPTFIVHGVIDIGRRLLRLRGADFGPLDSMVLFVRVQDQGMQALVNLPTKTGALNSLSGLVTQRIDVEKVSGHYCRLVEAQRANPDPDFTAQVRRAFSGGDGTAADNRALFVALSLLAAQIDVKALAGQRAEILKRCGTVSPDFMLLGRYDLSKHWSVSAALSSTFGTDASLSIGTWKEISDSGDRGSGFSLVDLSADRSGTFFAQRAADDGQAAAMRDWLARAVEADLLPVQALAFAEGLSESEFRSRYTDTDSKEFAATVQRIDNELAVLMK